MRLIDADELLKCIPREEYCSRFAIVNAPTIKSEQRWHVKKEMAFYDLETKFNELMEDASERLPGGEFKEFLNGIENYISGYEEPEC